MQMKGQSNLCMANTFSWMNTVKIYKCRLIDDDIEVNYQ